MLNVFFSKSAAYLMRQAQEISRPEDVLSIAFQLDMGDISPTNIELHGDTDQQMNLNKVITAATKGEAIRIWKSQAPHEACGFSFLCHQLKDVSSDLRVISLPEYIAHSENTLTAYSSWAEVHPDAFSSFLKYEETVTMAEKQLLADQWQTLQQENSPLRAVVNGQLLSVPENFYDHLIIRNIPEEKFDKEDLLAVIIGKYSLGISTVWYDCRIDQLIQDKLKEKEEGRR